MTPNTEYILHISHMKNDLKGLVDDAFSHSIDHEISWKVFREQLTHYKREQTLKWLELDAE